MTLIYNDALNKRIAPYLERLTKRRTGLDKESMALLDIFMQYFNTDTRYDTYSDKLEPCLLYIIQEEKIESIASLFDGRLNKLLSPLLGDEYAHLFHTCLKLLAQCPHTHGYMRRSQRSGNPLLHIDHVMDALTQFLKLRATGFTDQAILNGGTNPREIEAYKDSMGCQYWMAAQIAEGNPTVIQHLSGLLTGENNTQRPNHGHFQAIAISGYRPLLELEGKLLSATKLQESIRQAIVETMDGGCPESYLYLFSVIRDNDLLRFASVKRSIAICTGIGEQESGEHVTRQYIDRLHRFLNNREEARAALQSKDTAELYLALWSIGFYHTEEIQELVPEVVENGSQCQVQTLFHFLHCTQYVDMSHRIAINAFEKWHRKPSVVAAILPLYLSDFYIARYEDSKDLLSLRDYFDSKEEAVIQYGYLKRIYHSISEKEVYSPYVFPWESAELTHPNIALKMAYIALITNDPALTDDLCSYLPSLDTFMRSNYLSVALTPPKSSIQEEYVLQSMGDRSQDVREEAYRILSEMTLTPEQNRKVEGLLRFKYSEMRIHAINLLMKQPKEQLAGSIRRLLTDKVAERRLAGLDMMKGLRNTESMQDIYRELIPTVKEMQKPNPKEKVLIASMIGDGTEETVTQHYTAKNGFGLYDPSLEVNLPEIAPDKGFSVKKTFEFISFGRAKLVFKRLNRYIEVYKNKEFKNAYGEARLVGDTVLRSWNNCKGLNGLGFPELWMAFYEEEIRSYDKLLMMSFMLASTDTSRDEYDSDEENEEDIRRDRKSSLAFDPLVNRMYAGITYRGWQKELLKMPYYEQISDIIEALVYDYRDEAVYQRLSANMLLQLLPSLNTRNIFRRYTSKHAWLRDKLEYGEKEVVYPIHNNKFVNFWLEMPQKPISDELFIRYFTVRYQLYKLTDYMNHTPEPKETFSYLYAADFARAWMLGLIPTEEVYREMMGRVGSPAQLKAITTVWSDNIQKMTDRILEIELKRGDSETQVTSLAEAISCIYGAETFIRILQAFGKETFVRDSYNWKGTKRGVFSSLLHACHPLPTDTGEQLKRLANQAGIKDERLVEAAMFAPQWIELTEKAIGWKGLTSAAYYFHAHTNETCDDKKRAIIARYTPIDVDDLQEGAFDIDWFKDAFKTIGKQRFEVVYNASKYISCNNRHTRARKFADAINGAVKAENIEKEITAKRNKDLLMSYALIPLGRKPEKELLNRYRFLQKFLKESKEFSAQRQESEKKAVNIALQNLARNAGYGDVTRLIWSMETELIKELLPYLSPKKIDGVEVYVQIDGEGKAEMKQIKEGKELANLPAQLKKHPYIEELKAVHKKLKEQYTRSRVMLEQAMEDCTRFKESELHKLMRNPVIRPLLEHLVFICNGKTGFYTDGGLVTPNDAALPLQPKDELRIAHPTDLYASGDWHAYQKAVFDKSIRQPFKQVFRERYVPTREEAEATQSRRYAGNRVQPQKTIAALKGRRWVADDEGGLQKIYYKENIIAGIYALANWFSPADSEAPTVEHVCFHNRKDYKLMKISEVPPVIFSEVMRDVDLAVNVAHTGSVDPEAGPSTIEMRRVLVELTLPLFDLKNVTIQGNFARIEGRLGRYNIHLGNGAVLREDGARITVTPAQSLYRGRLFLPFADEDPKSTEILSKVIFFAADDKIKDPSILDQIKR